MKSIMGDRTRCLDVLEGITWGEPTFPSHLVKTCHALRRKPIGEFSIEDLRIMIGQRIGLPFLMPLAVELLMKDPLAEGDFYAGDLLTNVLRVDPSFWSEHRALRDGLATALRGLPELPKEVAPLVRAFLRGPP
jgi:hypothetical protein